MSRVRYQALSFTVSAIAVVAGAARAEAAEPDPSAPSVCAPPCPDGEICVGTSCVAPDARPTAPARPRAATPPPPQAPAGSASTTGPQPAGPPQPANAPPAPAPPSPAYAPPPNPPPPGHAPPPGYPPPSYYYPPPQPLGWYYLPPPAPPKPPRLKRRFLALPYFGVHTYQNRDASVYGPGVRLGSLIGGRLNDRLSLNADLTVDVSNIDGPAGSFLGSARIREYSVALAFAPLLQVPARPLEIVVGPKAGLFVMDTEITSGGVSAATSQQGMLFGIDTGVFLPVSATTSMGVLLTFEFRKPNDGCTAFSQSGVCSAGSTSGLASIVGLTAAVLF
jgi:hypothetical protein